MATGTRCASYSLVVIDMGLNERTTHALYDAFFAREITNRYYRGMADVSEVTASHDLGKLVAAGVLEPARPSRVMTSQIGESASSRRSRLWRIRSRPNSKAASSS